MIKSNEHRSFCLHVLNLGYNMNCSHVSSKETTMSANQLQDKVNAICNDLYAQGQKVSVRIVLSMMPEISSTSTIHKYYKQWKEELEANQKSLLEKMGFSEEFTRVFMSEITRHATEAERRYREIADDAKEQSSKAIEDLERAEERLHKQSALLEQRENQLKELQSELTQVTKSQEAVVAELRQQIEELQSQGAERIETIERLRTDLAKKELQLENNQEIVDTVKEQNRSLTEQLTSANQQAVVQAKSITRFESIQEANQTLIDELKLDKKSYAESVQRIEKDLRNTQQEKHTLQSSLNDVRNSERENLSKIERNVTSIAEMKVTLAQQAEMLSRYESLLKESESE